MTKQSILKLGLLLLLTLGIYNIVWLARTRGEMNALGADVPTTWLIIVPIANIWYMWKWSHGAAHVTNQKMSGPVFFLLQFLLGIIGDLIAQDAFNNIPAAQAAPVA